MPLLRSLKLFRAGYYKHGAPTELGTTRKCFAIGHFASCSFERLFLPFRFVFKVSTSIIHNLHERIDCRFDGAGFDQDPEGGESAVAGRVGQPRGGGGEFFRAGETGGRGGRGFSEEIPATLPPA